GESADEIFGGYRQFHDPVVQKTDEFPWIAIGNPSIDPSGQIYTPALRSAVGLEVRVPFCDHRLVEYVYNTPWALKTYDGREKSLLRGATRDVLPESVVKRVKSPYPSTSDPQYGAELQAHAKDLFGSGADLLFNIIDP